MKNLYVTKFIQKSGIFLLTGVMFFGISCKQNTRENDGLQQTEIDTTEIVQEVEPRAFTGDIRSVGNTGNISGEIAMRIEGDLMRFDITAKGLAPDMMHMQYLLVSQTGGETQCPGSVEDLTGIEAYEGRTTTSESAFRRIPLHMGGTLDIESDTYPRTNVNGDLQFSQVISLDSLRSSVRNEYQIQDLDFSKFTFVIRGIPEQQSSNNRVRGNTRSAKNTPVGCAKLQERAISN